MDDVTLAKKRLDYWMRKLDIYEHVECLAAAQQHPRLATVLKRLGHRIPRRPMLLDRRNVKYIKATDDWYPSYRDGMVAIRWYEDTKRISVWGDDDFGMSKEKATHLEFDQICSLPSVSQDMLRARGFCNI